MSNAHYSFIQRIVIDRKDNIQLQTRRDFRSYHRVLIHSVLSCRPNNCMDRYFRYVVRTGPAFGIGSTRIKPIHMISLHIPTLFRSAVGIHAHYRIQVLPPLYANICMISSSTLIISCQWTHPRFGKSVILIVGQFIGSDFKNHSIKLNRVETNPVFRVRSHHP